MSEHIIRNDERYPKGFEKLEFVSIFDHWLLPDESDLLHTVKPSEWKKFWALNNLLLRHFRILATYSESGFFEETQSEEFLHSGWHSDKPTGAKPLILKIPELDCVYEEHYDYTNLFWYNDSKALETFSEMVTSAGLYHFNREQGFQNRIPG